ncbi:MAG: hypothetical protein M1562_01430 [Candidatus Marsarchaeota archaeon]|jgi:hypothetical protein|nr:hypothetical protein [Candidatus Marsarchaeota archaeon]
MNDDINNMDSTIAHKFGLYQNSKRQSVIDLQLILSKNLYNEPLEKAKEGCSNGKEFVIRRSSFNKIIRDIKSENNNLFKLYSQIRREICDRVIKVYQNSFRRFNEKKNRRNVKVGFSRFKSRPETENILCIKGAESMTQRKPTLFTSKRIQNGG